MCQELTYKALKSAVCDFRSVAEATRALPRFRRLFSLNQHFQRCNNRTHSRGGTGTGGGCITLRFWQPNSSGHLFAAATAAAAYAAAYAAAATAAAAAAASFTSKST